MKSAQLGIKNAWHQKASTGFNILLLAVSFGLLSLVFSVEKQLQQQVKSNTQYVDCVIGPKGGSLQLVLSSLLHADPASGTIPFELTRKLNQNRLVKRLTSVSTGDQFKGFRVVGTDSVYPEIHQLTLKTGRWLDTSNEVVIGSYPAKQLNLQLGDKIATQHGIGKEAIQHSQELEVVGILNASQSVNDRLLFCATEYYWNAHNAENQAVSAIQLQFHNALGLMQLPRSIAQNTPYQAAVPTYEIERISQLIGSGSELFKWMGYALILLSFTSLLVQIYWRMKSRLKEMALLRLHGFSVYQLIVSFLVECGCMVFPALLVGFFLSRLGLHFLNSVENLPFQLQLGFYKEEIAFVLLVILTSILMVIVSTRKLFKMNLHELLKR